MIRRPPRSTQGVSSAASDVYKRQAKRLDWIKPFTTVKQTSFDDHHVDIKWFADGTLNVSYNCLDRHLAERGDQVAIIWEGDDPAESRNITYRELHEQVCKFANALRGQDVHRGDVVLSLIHI